MSVHMCMEAKDGCLPLLFSVLFFETQYLCFYLCLSVSPAPPHQVLFVLARLAGR